MKRNNITITVPPNDDEKQREKIQKIKIGENKKKKTMN